MAEQVNGASTPPISIVTFNIRNGKACDGLNSWRFRRRWVPEYIRTLDADIVGLQEAYYSQVTAIQAALKGYSRAGVGRDDGARAGEHCPIFYRTDRFAASAEGTFWFSDTPEVAGSRTWGNTLPRICTWVLLSDARTGMALRVCNLHLDHADQNARLRSAEMLSDRVEEWHRSSPVVVMGDFNAGERGPVIARILSDGTGRLRDTFRAVHPDAEGVGTYHGFTDCTDGAKIDHILATRDLAVLDAAILRDRIDGRYPSDHYPLTARLALDEGPARVNETG